MGKVNNNSRSEPLIDVSLYFISYIFTGRPAEWVTGRLEYCHCEPILIGVAISSTYTRSIYFSENRKQITENCYFILQFTFLIC